MSCLHEGQTLTFTGNREINRHKNTFGKGWERGIQFGEVGLEMLPPDNNNGDDPIMFNVFHCINNKI